VPRFRLLPALLFLTLAGGGAPEQSVSRAAEVPRRQTLLFAGDVMLARGVGDKMRAENDWEYPFEKIAPTLRAADLAFANLECPVSDAGRNRHHLYSFRADPRAIAGLTFAGLDVISLANNHADDWGPAALLDTLKRLREAGIAPVGAGESDRQAHSPVLVNLHGVRLAFLAYVDVEPRDAAAGAASPGVAWLEPWRVMADIRFARPLADVVIVCPHWGIEYARRPLARQVRWAHEMIDSGADLVVGSHPHVVQPLEEYHGRWIAYSLGNFVFDQTDPPARRGLMLRVTLEGKRIAAVESVPITIEPTFQTVLDAEKSAARPLPEPPAKVMPAKAEPCPARCQARSHARPSSGNP
jgi:poly-gamma-glutamate capsule biosynthesis protein CapA/YwtB (metallophosphatase superfamily)